MGKLEEIEDKIRNFERFIQANQYVVKRLDKMDRLLTSHLMNAEQAPEEKGHCPYSYSRSNRPWFPEEDEELKNAFQTFLQAQCSRYGRSMGGIESRLWKIFDRFQK